MNHNHNNQDRRQQQGGYQPPYFNDYQSIDMEQDSNAAAGVTADTDHQNQPYVQTAAVPAATAPPAVEDNINMYENNAKLSGKKQPDNSNDDDGPSNPSHPLVPDATNLQAPSYQKVERPVAATDPLATSSHDGEKSCRICLEDDDQASMIAPCKCSGFSKWVHRDCLDEWRLNERDRAFSQCTECTFEYYMQPVYKENSGERWRKMRFCWNVSREVCFGTLLLQLVIFALAAIVYACDTSKALPNEIMPVFANHPWTLYYLLGWLSLLVVVGLYGSCVLCSNGCSIKRSIPQVHPPSAASQNTNQAAPRTVMSGATDEDRFARGMGLESNTEFYRRARHRRRRRNRHYYDDAVCCCDSCRCCSTGHYPFIIYDDGTYPCCCCCCEDTSSSAGGASSSDAGCGDCCGRGGGDGDRKDCSEGIHILLIILLVVAVVLAVIGFFVGLIISVVAFQRVVQRHIHLIQKRQLVQEYQVMDLQDYDLNQPLPTAPRAEDLEWNGAVAPGSSPAPSAPLEPLPEKDVSYLQKLGLME